MTLSDARTTMTVPLIDGIDSDNFEYRPVYQGSTNFRGIFEWGMLYKENEVPEQEARTRSFNSEPYRYNSTILNVLIWFDKLLGVIKVTLFHASTLKQIMTCFYVLYFRNTGDYLIVSMHS